MDTEGRIQGIARRRKRSAGDTGGFSNSGLTDATRTEGAPRNLNEEVQSMLEGPGDGERLPIDDKDEFSPRNRMKTVSNRASNYEREYRLKLLHRMLMRNVPLDEVAQQLEVSVSTVLRDRRELHNRLREEAKKLDLNQMIGDTVGFYKEVQAMALRTSSAAKTPVGIKMSALRTSLAAQNDQHRFLQTVGVYDVLRYRVASSDGEGNDLSRLATLTKKMLEMGDDQELDSSELGIARDDDEEELHLL